MIRKNLLNEWPKTKCYVHVPMWQSTSLLFEMSDWFLYVMMFETKFQNKYFAQLIKYALCKLCNYAVQDWNRALNAAR